MTDAEIDVLLHELDKYPRREPPAQAAFLIRELREKLAGADRTITQLVDRDLAHDPPEGGL